MKSNWLKRALGIFLLSLSFSCIALQERHLIFIRQGGVHALTPLGKEHIQQTGEILLTHGFDNRSITAVYAIKDKGSLECAKQLAKLGLFSENKIHKQDEMDLAFYDSIEKKYQQGHVIIIDDNTSSPELIESLTHHPVDRNTQQPYIVPFSPRKA